MAHHIYHTRGIILSSTATGESNRFYKIFTEELGLIGGSAQSVREGKSKLRYALQDFSLVTVDLVRGKEVWRIVSAGAYQPLEGIKKDTTRLKLFARFCAVLSRLIQGEGRDKELYDEIIRVVNILEQGEFSEAQVLTIETLMVFRMLVHLGYIDPIGFEVFLADNAYRNDVREDFEKIRRSVLPKINEALNASHL